jgi:hypothetical protein
VRPTLSETTTLGAVLMPKAKKKTGRKKTEGSTHPGESIASNTLQQLRQFHWAPNTYANVAGSNVLIAAVALGIIYATLTYFDATAISSKTTAADKAHPDRAASHKSKQASTGEDQSKKSKNEASDAEFAPKGTTAFVSDNNVLIREKPKINAKILGRAIFGTSIEVLMLDGKWPRIYSSAQDLSGWTEKSGLNF